MKRKRSLLSLLQHVEREKERFLSPPLSTSRRGEEETMEDAIQEDLYNEGVSREREELSTSRSSLLPLLSPLPSKIHIGTLSYSPTFSSHPASSSSSLLFTCSSSSFLSRRGTLSSLENVPVTLSSTCLSKEPTEECEMKAETETREMFLFLLSHLHRYLSIPQRPEEREKEKEEEEGENYFPFFFVWMSNTRSSSYDSRESDRTSYRVYTSPSELRQLKKDNSAYLLRGGVSHVFCYPLFPSWNDAVEMEGGENRCSFCRSFKRQGRAKKIEDNQGNGDKDGKENDEKETPSLLSLSLFGVSMEREDMHIPFLSRQNTPSLFSSFISLSRQDLPVFSRPLYHPLLLLQVSSSSHSFFPFKSLCQAGQGAVLNKDRMRRQTRKGDTTESPGRRRRRRTESFDIAIPQDSFSDAPSPSISPSSSSSSCLSSTSCSQVSSSFEVTENPCPYPSQATSVSLPFSCNLRFCKHASSCLHTLPFLRLFSSTVASPSPPLSRCSHPPSFRASSSPSPPLCSSPNMSVSRGPHFSPSLSSSYRLRYRRKFSDHSSPCCTDCCRSPSRSSFQTSRHLRRKLLLSPSFSSPTSSLPSSSSSSLSFSYPSSSPSSCLPGEGGKFREGAAIVSLQNLWQLRQYKSKGVEEQEEKETTSSSFFQRLKGLSHTGWLEKVSLASHRGSRYSLQKRREKGDIKESKKGSMVNGNLSHLEKIQYSQVLKESSLSLLSLFFSFSSRQSLLSFLCLYLGQLSLSSSSLFFLSVSSLVPLLLSLLSFPLFVVSLFFLPFPFLVVLIRDFLFSSKSLFFSLFASRSSSLPPHLFLPKDSTTSVTKRLLHEGDRTLSSLEKMVKPLLRIVSSWIRRKGRRSSFPLHSSSSSSSFLPHREEGEEGYRLPGRRTSRRKEGKSCYENASVSSSSSSLSSSFFKTDTLPCPSSSSPLSPSSFSSFGRSPFKMSFSSRREEEQVVSFSNIHHSFSLFKGRGSLRRLSSSILVLSSFLLSIFLPSSSSSSLPIFLSVSLIPSFFSFFHPSSSSSFSSSFHMASLSSSLLFATAQQHQQQQPPSQGMYFNPSHPAQLSSSSLPYQQMAMSAPFNPTSGGLQTSMSFSPSQAHPPVRGGGGEGTSSSSSSSYAVGLSPMQQLQVLHQPRPSTPPQSSSPQLLNQQQSMILGAIAQQNQQLNHLSPSLPPSPSMALSNQASSSSPSFSQLSPDIQRELLRILSLQQQLQQQQQIPQQAFAGLTGGGERGGESFFPSSQGFPHQMEGRGGQHPQAAGGNGSRGSGNQVYVHPTGGGGGGGGVGNPMYYLQNGQNPNNFILSQPTQETPETFLRGGYLPTSPLSQPQQTLNYANLPSSSLPQTGRPSPLSSPPSSQNNSANLQLSEQLRHRQQQLQPGGHANQQEISSSPSAASSFSPSVSSYLNILDQSGNVNAFHGGQPPSFHPQNTFHNYPSIPGAAPSSMGGGQHQLEPPPSLQDLSLLSLPHLLSLLQTGGGTGEAREEGEAERYQEMMKSERLRQDGGNNGRASAVGVGVEGGGESSSILFNAVVKAILDDLAAGRTGTVEKLAEVLLRPLPEHQRQQIYSVLLQRLSEKAASRPSLDLGSSPPPPPLGLFNAAGEGKEEAEGKRRREGEERGGVQHQYEGGGGRLKVLAASSSSDLSSSSSSSSSDHILGGFSSPSSSSSALPIQTSSSSSLPLHSSHGSFSSSSVSSSDLSERIAQCLALPSCQAIEGETSRLSKEKESQNSQRNEGRHERKPSSSSSSKRTKQNSSSSSQQDVSAPYHDLFPSTWEPRCASDGNTYANACVFDVEACVRSATGQEPLLQLHEGSCRSPSSPALSEKHNETLQTSSSPSSSPSTSSSSSPHASSAGLSSSGTTSSSSPPSVVSKQAKPHGQLKKIGSGEGDSSSSLVSSSSSSLSLSPSPSPSPSQGVGSSSGEKTRKSEKEGEEKSSKEEKGVASTHANESSTSVGGPQQKKTEEKEEEDKEKNKKKNISSHPLKEVNSGSTSSVASREGSPSTQKNTSSSSPSFPPGSSSPSSSKDKGEESPSSFSTSKKGNPNLSPSVSTTSTSTSTPGGTNASSPILAKSRNPSSPSPRSSSPSVSHISPASSSKSPPVAHTNTLPTPLQGTGPIEKGERREERKESSNLSLSPHSYPPQKEEIHRVHGTTAEGEKKLVGSETGEVLLQPHIQENLSREPPSQSVGTNVAMKQESIGEALVNRFAALMRGDRVPGDGAAVQLAVAEAEKIAAEKERKKREKLEKIEEKMKKKKKKQQEEGHDKGGEEEQANGENEEEDLLIDDEEEDEDEEDEDETSLTPEEDDSGEAKLERLKKEMAANPQRASIEKLMKKREAVQHLQELQQLQLNLLQQQQQQGQTSRGEGGEPIDPRLYTHPSLIPSPAILPLPMNDVDMPGIPSHRNPSLSSSFLNGELPSLNSTSSSFSPSPRPTDPRSFLWSAHNVTTIQELMEERTKVKINDLLLRQSQSPNAQGEGGRGERNPMAAQKVGGLVTTLEGQGQPGGEGEGGGGRGSKGGPALQTSNLRSFSSPSSSPPSLSYNSNSSSFPPPPSTSSSSSSYPYLPQSLHSVPSQGVYRTPTTATTTAASSSPSIHQSNPSLSSSLSPNTSSPGFLQQNSVYSSSSPAIPPPQHPYSVPPSQSSQQAGLNASSIPPQLHANNPGLSLSPSYPSPSLPYPYSFPQGGGRGSGGGEFQQHAQSLSPYSSPPSTMARPMVANQQQGPASQMYTNTNGGGGAPSLGGYQQTSPPPSFNHPREGVLPSSPPSPSPSLSSSASSSGPGMFLYGQQQQPPHQGSQVTSPRASPPPSPFTSSSSSSSSSPLPPGSSPSPSYPYPSYSVSPSSSSSHQLPSFSSPSSYGGLVNPPPYYAYPSTQSPSSSFPPQSSSPPPPTTSLSPAGLYPGGRVAPALPPPSNHSQPSSPLTPTFLDSRGPFPYPPHPTSPNHLPLSPTPPGGGVGVGGVSSSSSLSPLPHQPHDTRRDSSSPPARSEGSTPSSSRDGDIHTGHPHHRPSKKDSETKNLFGGGEKKKSTPGIDIPSHFPSNSVNSDPSPSSSSPFSSPPQCNFLCPAGGPVVCGTDNQTYTNECEARVYACLKRDPSLTVKHKGPCKRLHSNSNSSSGEPSTASHQQFHTTGGSRYSGRSGTSTSSSMREGRSGSRLERNDDRGGGEEDEEEEDEEGKRKKKNTSNGRPKKKEKGGKALSEEEEENEGVASDEGMDEKLRSPKNYIHKVKKVKREDEEEEEENGDLLKGAGEMGRRKDEKEEDLFKQQDLSLPLHDNHIQRDTKKSSVSSSSSSKRLGSNSLSSSQAPPSLSNSKPVSLEKKEREAEENEDSKESSSSLVSLTLEGITQTIPKYRRELPPLGEEHKPLQEEEETFLRNHAKKNLHSPSSPTPLSFLSPSSSTSSQATKKGTPDDTRRKETPRGKDKEEGYPQVDEEKAFRISANAYKDDDDGDDENRKSFLGPSGRRGVGGGGEGMVPAGGPDQKKKKSLLLTESEEDKRHGNFLEKDDQRPQEKEKERMKKLIEGEEDEGNHRQNLNPNGNSYHSHPSHVQNVGEGETSTRRRDDLTTSTSPLLSNSLEKIASSSSSSSERAKTDGVGHESSSLGGMKKIHPERKSDEERKKKDDKKKSHLKGSGGGKEVVDYLADLARLREMIDSDDFGEEEDDEEEESSALDKQDRKREEEEEDDGVITDEPYIYDGSEIAKDDYSPVSGTSPRTSHSSDMSSESGLRDSYLNPRRYPNEEEKRHDTNAGSSLLLSLSPSSTKNDKNSAVRSSTPSAGSGRSQPLTHQSLSGSSSPSQPTLSGMSAMSPGVEKSKMGDNMSGSSSLSPSLSPPSLLDFFKGWF